jgi:acyl carrier protein
MDPVSTVTTAKPAGPEKPEDKIRHLPAEVRASFRRFQTQGDLAALDPVIAAILADFVPRKSTTQFTDLPGSTRLIDDLGFDSLSITELVFFTEDLLGISIANEEILQVRTLDDLRQFVRRKVAARAAG